MADEPVRLLYDQNYTVSLVTSLAGSYPGSAHVRGEGLSTASDRAIWEYARDHGFAIVTKDVDFLRLSALLGTAKSDLDWAWQLSHNRRHSCV